MLTRLLSLLAIWTLVVACCFAFGEAPAQPSPDIGTYPTAETRGQSSETTSTIAGEPSVDWQMRGLAHHARLGMILSAGHFGGDPSAVMKTRLDAVAVTLRVGNR